MPAPGKKQLILASASPRRRDILARTGLEFLVVPSDYEEKLRPGVPPRELAKELARGKAEAVARGRTGAVVIGADTFIVLDGELLGKPRTPDRAAAMLSALSGRAHSVITGFAVIDADSGRIAADAVETRVWFRQLDAAEISSYVQSGEPLDKAGAYAIQGLGGRLIEKIEGDRLNVVGLPLAALCGRLREFGIDARPPG